eukprot:scaffold2720_cov173-Amphora_coffeaeformis.AAC.1
MESGSDESARRAKIVVIDDNGNENTNHRIVKPKHQQQQSNEEEEEEEEVSNTKQASEESSALLVGAQSVPILRQHVSSSISASSSANEDESEVGVGVNEPPVHITTGDTHNDKGANDDKVDEDQYDRAIGSMRGVFTDKPRATRLPEGSLRDKQQEQQQQQQQQQHNNHNYNSNHSSHEFLMETTAPIDFGTPPRHGLPMIKSGVCLEDALDFPEQHRPVWNNDEISRGDVKDHRVQRPSSLSSWWSLKRYDPTPWLVRDAQIDNHTGEPYFPPETEWTAAGLVRRFLYDPITPEFTSLQQFTWANVIGILMGIYTALWKMLVEACIDVVWVTVPKLLLQYGFFTSIHGWFPQYHYMWIVPTLFGSFLSYMFVVLPVKIPGQNEWISSLHRTGVQDYRTFWPLFLLSTMGMTSGMSLGPELPLILTSGMFGSWLGLACRQSTLQARVMNMTAASAAIGGFFGFPMAGALFVLELPHRSGLQYFEALTPTIVSSIVAVVTNRLIIQNDVTGYFKYPFLSDSLPSSIFWHAIIFGVFGCAVGTGYLVMVVRCKTWVHDWFHVPVPQDEEEKEQEQKQDDDSNAYDDNNFDGNDDAMERGDTNPKQVVNLTKASSGETDALLAKNIAAAPSSSLRSTLSCVYSLGCIVIPEESHRAALAGALAGFICGWVGIFVPHTLFWGEAQLQSLIDKGRTPLPVFGDFTGDMVSLGQCIIDPKDPAAIMKGFSLGCAGLIAVSKTLVTGLSLGTGIIGGHFWGPLFVGCASGYFLSDIIHIVADWVGMGSTITVYPCLIILCTMGAAHVVSFRAHTAIMLILTLTISAFSPEDENPYFGMAGDYAAVFPLLVISVFISMVLSRDMVFYTEQRNRDDILAVPQVLCEPGMSDQDAFSDDSEASLGETNQNESHPMLGDAGSHARRSFNADGSIHREPGADRGAMKIDANTYGAMDTSPDVVFSSGLDAFLSTPVESHVANATTSRHSRNSSYDSRIINSVGGSAHVAVDFAPHLFEQARVHRGRASACNSVTSGSEFVNLPPSPSN